jgi:hypothetical protein
MELIMTCQGTSRRFLLSLAALAASATGGPLLAGPLDPPPGPVAPTHKTLTEVEPRTAINSVNTPGDANSQFRVALPGSYYLTGNITGAVSLRGIEIAASDVVIDLNGFSMNGVAGSLQGIATDGSRSDIVIRNGSVNGWASDGINLVQGGGTGTQHRVESARVSTNGGAGISVGTSSVVRECISVSNTGNGFTGTFLARFEGCVARFSGVRGFQTQGSCIFSHCSAVQSTLDGFFIWGECVLTDCHSYTNGGHGIESNSQVSITRCVVTGNTENGMLIDDDCSVKDCTIRDNDGSGIVALVGCAIEGCTITGNGLHGVTSGSGGRIIANSCARNGTGGLGAGVQVTGSDALIEGNNVTENDRGVQATAAGNFITRNIASGNTTLNWEIAANNKCHVVLGVNAGAISGDSGGTSQGSTNPNANYTY